MHLQQSIKNVFVQITDSLQQLTGEEYRHPSATLSNATIGQHVRHVIELFLCLNQGYESGMVNYEKRKRDIRIETDSQLAIGLLHEIYAGLDKPDKELILESNYDEHTDSLIHVKTNYYREIIYNLEHTVHHMALIRVGINEISGILLPDGFGVASSTIKYRKQHVHS